MKLKSKFILAFLGSLLMLLPLQAQVTVGSGDPPQTFSILEVVSNGEGGLRLPQMTTAERNTVTDAAFKANALAEGLAIFNTTTKCYEYWNGSRWVSICKGDANITFTDDGGNTVDPFATNFLCQGETRGPFTPHDSEECIGMPSAFSFLIMIGDGYTSFNTTDPATGKFTLTMNANPTARSRNAVLRVTNNCTGEYKEFLFMQEGCTDVCQPNISKPIITTSNSGAICSMGAVYMNITNADAAANYVWTLNEVEIPEYRGKSYCVATQNGTYRVYVGGIGCDTNASDEISVTLNNSSTAPAAVTNITATNNGVICSTADVKLTAYGVPSTGTLTWYKNGVKTTKTGNPISLVNGDQGDWFAVMEESNCTSKPSNAITVTYDPSNTKLDDPVITVNGVQLTSAHLCIGGYTQLEVTNTYSVGVSIQWYNGQNLIGTGASCIITAPAAGSTMLLRCVVADNTGTYCTAEVIKEMTITGSAPSRPSISGNPNICGGSPALLSATLVSGATYKWFLNGAEISGATTSTYSANTAGSYQVQIIDNGGCISQLSPAIEVTLSAFPNIQFIAPTNTSEPSQVITFEVLASQNPTSYVWSLSSPSNTAVLLDGSNPNTASSTTTTNTIRVQLGTANETVTITCYAVNDCGSGTPASHDLTVTDGCTVPSPNVNMSPQGTVLVGTTISMSVTATGTAPFTYQWKKNGAAISGATSATYSFVASSTTDNGTYSVDVSNVCGGITNTVNGVAGTIDVTDVGTVPDGPGTLSGETCFDINSGTNDNAICGQTGNRQTADFSQSYTYTFLNLGANNSDLSWIIQEDPAGSIIDYANSTITNTTGTLVDGGNYTINLKFKPSLASDAIGTTFDDAFIVTIYAIYKVNGVANRVSLQISIRDCACECGAYSYTGEWLRFMCHNLGANTTIDPKEWLDGGNMVNDDVKGFLYQWGRRSDGHQSRTSTLTTTLATSSTPEDGRFIYGSADWRSGAPSDARWGDGTASANPAKAANDPCPDGWKIPSATQWASLLTGTVGITSITSNTTVVGNNTWIRSNYGYEVGDRLFLPAAGNRDYSNGIVSNSGVSFSAAGGWYWSSTNSTSSNAMLFYTGFDRLGLGPIARGYGSSIRCIKE